MATLTTSHNTLSTSYYQAILGGIVGTLPMSALMYLRPYIGFYPWPVPHVISGLMHTQLWGGWLAHFLIGIIFSILYLFTFNRVPIRSRILKGALYGIPAYIVAFGTWYILSALHVVHFETFAPISYPYLIEHIVFAATMALFIPHWENTKEWILR